MLRNMPPHIPPMSEEEKRATASWLDSLGKAEREILRQYRTSPNIPKSHAYEMASLGDESLEGFESEIIARDDQYRLDAQKSRSKGGQARGNETDMKAKQIAEINRDLIEKFLLGKLSVGEVARRIHNRWQERGIPKTPRPSQKTLERYVKRAVSEK